MNDKILFSNKSCIEKVTIFERKDRSNFSLDLVLKHRLLAVICFLIFAAASVAASIMPGSGRLTAVRIVLYCFTVIYLVKIFLPQRGPRDIDLLEKDRSEVYQTGESTEWIYDFYENAFTVKCSDTDEEKTIDYSEISSVRDAGASYQIKCDKNYTLKKSGFTEGGEKKFIGIMKAVGIGALLKDKV